MTVERAMNIDLLSAHWEGLLSWVVKTLRAEVRRLQAELEAETKHADSNWAKHDYQLNRAVKAEEELLPLLDELKTVKKLLCDCTETDCNTMYQLKLRAEAAEAERDIWKSADRDTRIATGYKRDPRPMSECAAEMVEGYVRLEAERDELASKMEVLDACSAANKALFDEVMSRLEVANDEVLRLKTEVEFAEAERDQMKVCLDANPYFINLRERMYGYQSDVKRLTARVEYLEDAAISGHPPSMYEVEAQVARRVVDYGVALQRTEAEVLRLEEEVFNHRMCHDMSAATIQQLKDLLDESEQKLRIYQDLDTCCCGSPMNAHTMGDGHSPVSEYYYHIDSLKREADRYKEKLRYIHEECAENMAKSYAGLVLEGKR